MGRLALMLLISLAACGSKSKGPTTPAGGDKDGDKPGMEGKDPVGDGRNGGGPADPADPDDHADPDDPDDDDDDGGDDGPVTTTPKVEPPVLDMSEQERNVRVQGSLARARAALEAQNRDPNLAIKEARDALGVDPNSVDAVVVLAHAYYFRKLYDTAGVLLDRVVNSNVEVVKQRANKHAGLFYVYGLVFDKTNEPARAAFAYEQARNLSPDHKGVLMNLGVHYLRDSRYDDAKDIYEKLTGGLGVRTAAAWTNLGSAYRGMAGSGLHDGERNSLLQKAETAYKRAVDTDKNYAIAYYDLGLLYMDAKPFPLGSGNMDDLVRLDRAKTYFKEYRALPGADIALVDDRVAAIDKAIKKETKARKKAEDEAKKKEKGEDDDW